VSKVKSCLTQLSLPTENQLKSLCWKPEKWSFWSHQLMKRANLTVFFLRICTEEALAVCVQLPEPEETVATSEWRGTTAGGCIKYATWDNNPKFVITPSTQPTGSLNLTLSVRQEDRNPLYYIGVNAGKYTGKVPDRGTIVFKNNPTNAKESFLDISVSPDTFPLWIVPYTFEQNQQGKFDVIVKSSIKFYVTPLIPGTTPTIPKPNPPTGNTPTTTVAIPTNTQNPSKWTVDEVCEQLKALQLSQDYSQIIKSNTVDGTVVCEMKTRDDWKELGISSFGDLTKLAKFSSELPK